MIDEIGFVSSSEELEEGGGYPGGYWHVNASYPVPELAAYLLDPQPVTPQNVFAGAPTYCYQFADEQAWEAFVAAHSDADGNLLVTPRPAAPPNRVSMRQARLALVDMGLLATVNSAIDALEEPAKTVASIEWDYAHIVERNSAIVAMLSAAIGLSSNQVDNLFRVAAGK